MWGGDPPSAPMLTPSRTAPNDPGPRRARACQGAWRDGAAAKFANCQPRNRQMRASPPPTRWNDAAPRMRAQMMAGRPREWRTPLCVLCAGAVASGAARNPARGDPSRRASWPGRPSRAGPRRPAVGLGPGGSRRPWKGAGRDSARWEGPQYTLPKSRARGGARRAGAGRAGARADIFGPRRPRRPGRGPMPWRGPPARRAGRSLGGRMSGGNGRIWDIPDI